MGIPVSFLVVPPGCRLFGYPRWFLGEVGVRCGAYRRVFSTPAKPRIRRVVCVRSPGRVPWPVVRGSRPLGPAPCVALSAPAPAPSVAACPVAPAASALPLSGAAFATAVLCGSSSAHAAGVVVVVVHAAPGIRVGSAVAVLAASVVAALVAAIASGITAGPSTVTRSAIAVGSAAAARSAGPSAPGDVPSSTTRVPCVIVATNVVPSSRCVPVCMHVPAGVTPFAVSCQVGPAGFPRRFCSPAVAVVRSSAWHVRSTRVRLTVLLSPGSE